MSNGTTSETIAFYTQSMITWTMLPTLIILILLITIVLISSVTTATLATVSTNTLYRATSNYSLLEIVTSHYNENLHWLKKSPYPVSVVSKIGAKPSAIKPRYTIPNNGNEASSYLHYIVHNYHTLPPYIAFIHGHKDAWHHKNGSILHQLKNLNLYNVKYHTLNNCPVKEWNIKNSGCMKSIAAYWDSYFKQWLGEKPPLRASHDCCAQFVVSREVIQSQPLEAYITWLDFSLTKPSKLVGYIFEILWHIIMGEKAVTPLNEWSCRK